MPKQAEVTYLFNSGFIVELKDKILIFDYFKDDEHRVLDVLKKGKKVFFFSSHSHHDHFVREIMRFEECTARYFLSFDIEEILHQEAFSQEKVTFLQAYDAYQDEEISVKTFSSTDIGVSFLVEADGWHIFHAGDFNWWHWKGDLVENNNRMKALFMKQMEKLEGLKADIAFFPVDLRMGKYCDMGVKEFCLRTHIDNLVAMHNTGNKPWQIPREFVSKNKGISIWIPEKQGENIKMIK